jgi:hypothetical protein
MKSITNIFSSEKAMIWIIAFILFIGLLVWTNHNRTPFQPMQVNPAVHQTVGIPDWAKDPAGTMVPIGETVQAESQTAVTIARTEVPPFIEKLKERNNNE